MMEEQLIKLATEHGLWALVSIALLFYILKKQEIQPNRVKVLKNKRF